MKALRVKGVSAFDARRRSSIDPAANQAAVIRGLKVATLAFLPRSDAARILGEQYTEEAPIGWTEFMCAQQLLRDSLAERRVLPVQHQEHGLVGVLIYAEELVDLLRARRRRGRRVKEAKVVRPSRWWATSRGRRAA